MPNLGGNIIFFHCFRDGTHVLSKSCAELYNFHDYCVSKLGKINYLIPKEQYPPCSIEKLERERLRLKNPTHFNAHPFLIIDENKIDSSFLVVPLQLKEKAEKKGWVNAVYVVTIDKGDVINYNLSGPNYVLCDQICRLKREYIWHFDGRSFGRINQPAYEHIVSKVTAYLNELKTKYS